MKKILVTVTRQGNQIMRMVSLLGLLLIAVALLLPQSADAALVWGTSGLGELSGSRTSGGIYATDGWANGNFDLSWNISQNQSSGLWTYVYNVDVVRKDVSHFLLEVSNDGHQVATYPGTDCNISGPQLWSATTNGNSNPQMPNSLYGVKFDFGGTTATYTFVTDRAPVYGVFYAKDGKDGGIPVVGWSTALNYANYQSSATLTTTDFIVRPDSLTPTPIPAAAWLLGSGLLGLVGLRRKQK